MIFIIAEKESQHMYKIIMKMLKEMPGERISSADVVTEITNVITDSRQ